MIWWIIGIVIYLSIGVLLTLKLQEHNLHDSIYESILITLFWPILYIILVIILTAIFVYSLVTDKDPLDEDYGDYD